MLYFTGWLFVDRHTANTTTLASSSCTRHATSGVGFKGSVYVAVNTWWRIKGIKSLQTQYVCSDLMPLISIYYMDALSWLIL